MASARCGSPGRSTRSAGAEEGRRWIGFGAGIGGTIWDTAVPMARRRTPTAAVPDNVREAVERTIQATLTSAQETRGKAQDAVDDIFRGAEASAEAVRGRVRGAIQERRPATSDDIRDVQSELRALARRLDAIEARLEKARAQGGGRTAASKRAASGSGKRSASGRGGSGAASGSKKPAPKTRRSPKS